jgi:hypothetical protein
MWKCYLEKVNNPKMLFTTLFSIIWPNLKRIFNFFYNTINYNKIIHLSQKYKSQFGWTSEFLITYVPLTLK